MYVLHLSVDCQGCFFVRLLVWRLKYMIDVHAGQREYAHESQDCTRYQVPGTSIIEIVVPPWMIVSILILISIVTHVRTKPYSTVNVETPAHNLSCNFVGGVWSVWCDKHLTLLFCRRFSKTYVSKTSKVRFVSVRDLQ
jgi:hypothetical protein